MTSALLSLALIHFLSALSPGPNFVMITRQAVASRRSALWTALGITLGSLTWALIAVCGLGVVLTQVAWLYTGLKLLGAAYLAYIGVKMLLGAFKPAPPMAELPAVPARSALRLGLTTSLTNPKSAAYWGSVFAAALPAHAELSFYAAALAVVISISLGWHLLLAVAFGAEPMRRAYRRLARWIDGVTGTVLIGFGISLAASR